jgi:regulator of sigma E protease
MSILIFIVMLVALILGHEFGHFVFAKFAKMKVLEFGIGFPPRVWGTKIGETEYTVNALPFGGFVKIFGEDSPDAAGDPRSFSERPKLAQALTLAAGPLANLFIAFILFSVAFMVGVPTVFEGADVYARDARVIVVEVVPGSPAEEAGIEHGDRILSIAANGRTTSIETPEDVVSAVSSATDAVALTLERKGKQVMVSATPVAGLIAEEPWRKALGLAPALVGTLAYPVQKALLRGFVSTVQNTVGVVTGLAHLIGRAFLFSADFSGISGPVGIAGLVGDAAAYGIGAVLSFAALISINLAVINFLPFPALDGGRLALLGVETVMRRKVPRVIANGLNLAGFALLFILMLAVTVHDIGRLVG